MAVGIQRGQRLIHYPLHKPSLLGTMKATLNIATFEPPRSSDWSWNWLALMNRTKREIAQPPRAPI
jgi:hypothetical protein